MHRACWSRLANRAAAFPLSAKTVGMWVFAATLLPSPVAAQLTGTWQSTVTEVSNICGDPLGPPEMSQLDIVQEGNLVDIDVIGGGPGVTEISGEVSGTNLSIGFEAFRDGGVQVHDPAFNTLVINQGATMISGDLNWEFYEPIDCVGTQTWSGTKDTAGTPGDLSGAWTVTITEVSDSCGPIEQSPVIVPATVVQEGNLIDVTTIDFGQTRLIGRVSGQTLSLGLAVKEDEGDLTIFDAANNLLTIQPDFASFSGLMSWESYESLVCTGVETIVMPEPGAGIAALATLGSLLALGGGRRVG